jgi:hypothetical protein
MTDTIIGGGAPAGPALGASFLSPQAASSVSSKPEMISLLDRVLLFLKFRHIQKKTDRVTCCHRTDERQTKTSNDQNLMRIAAQGVAACATKDAA